MPLPPSSVSGDVLDPIDRPACQTIVEPRLTVIPSVLGFGVRLTVESVMFVSVNISRTALPRR